jgi:hypothetical protein
MHGHMNSPKLLQRACGVLWNVTCNNDANKLVVVSLQGIDALVKAMSARPEHQGIQREACGALRNLSLLAANKPLVGRPAVVQAVVSAMSHHALDADIQEQACVLLYSVSDTKETVDAVVSSGGVEAVITAIKNHSKKPSVLEEGFGLMYKLARTGLAQVRDPNREAFALATRSIQAHPSHDGVRKYAQGMITEWNNPSYAARFGASSAPTPGGPVQPLTSPSASQSKRSSARNSMQNAEDVLGNVSEKANLKELRKSRRSSPGRGVEA